MLDLHTRITTLKRPSLLVRAARFGFDEYRRSVHLGRILQAEKLPGHADAIMQLLDIEAAVEARRLARAGDYRPARHVEILIAIAGEAALLRATSQRPVR